MKYDNNIITATWREYGLPAPVFEYQFHPVRKWRIDIAYPDYKLAIEVQGGIFIQGRHSRGAALLKEWEKLNTLACMGWRVLYCEPKSVCKYDFIVMVTRAMEVAR